VSDAEVEALLEQLATCLAREDEPAARRVMAQLRACAGADHLTVQHAHARYTWLAAGARAAYPLLRSLAESHPEHAELLYDLGCVAEELEDHSEMVRCFLKVRRLDARADRELGIGSDRELLHIERVAREVLERLPAMFGERLSHVPVILEQRPSRALVEEGFDPRAFGLFDGPTEGTSDVPMPTRIVLYAANLLAEFPEEPELSEQIEVTVLHEVGHFFNLDEDQLERLGLA
jgi:predicted Zn-dependent protease with MMP-like domain